MIALQAGDASLGFVIGPNTVRRKRLVKLDDEVIGEIVRDTTIIVAGNADDFSFGGNDLDGTDFFAFEDIQDDIGITRFSVGELKARGAESGSYFHRSVPSIEINAVIAGLGDFIFMAEGRGALIFRHNQLAGNGHE